jgi:YD repeat-containing protein
LVGLPVTRAGATATYRDQIMANGPVAYFRFGEASRGSSVQNEAWTTWNGVPAQPTADWSSSGVTFGTAHSGFDGDTAVTFSGSTPGSATVDTWPFQKGSVTYEAWVKPASLPASGTQANLMSVPGCCYGYTVAGLKLSLTSSGTVLAEVGTDNFATVPWISVESPEPVSTGSWNHVVAVYDAGTKSVWVFTDGGFDGQQDRRFGGVGWNGTPALSDRELVMGGFDGSMDEVAIYDRALSVAEVRTDYLASGLPAPSGWHAAPTTIPNTTDPDTTILGPNASKNYDELLRCDCADPVDTGSGNLHMPIVSVTVPGRGPGLDVSMAYNSLGAGVRSSMGYGWSSTLDMRIDDDSVLERKIVVQETGATVPFQRGSGGSYSAPDGFTATLTPVSGTTDWLFTRNHTEKFRFDQAGRLVAISDQYGNTTAVTYWSNTPSAAEFRRVKRYTDAAGRYLEVTWNATTSIWNGLVASITEPAITGQAARTATFTYDGSGNKHLLEYKDVSGGVTKFTYNNSTAHLMTRMQKPRHSSGAAGTNDIENGYDSKGRVIWQEDELNRRTDFAYDTPSAGRTTVTMPPYDASGDLRLTPQRGHSIRR